MNLLELARYFLRLGATGFGGPLALVGYMQRDLVEKRGWYTSDEFARGLALAQISPGPLAAQLASYLGWLRGGAAGAVMIAIAFVAPSLFMVLAISALYVRFGELSWLQPAFLGVGAAVVGILARSAFKLARLTLSRDHLLWAIAAANTAGVLVLRRESLLVLLAGGGVALVVSLQQVKTAVSAAGLFVLQPANSGWHLHSGQAYQLWQLLEYFAVSGAVVFGSGLAIIPYLFHGVVEQRHWLTEPQFLDAIAVSMITPGPVVITVAFIGYLVAGTPGALASAVGVFVPSLLAVVIFAPHFERITANASAKRFVQGITAGATGAIGGAAILLSSRILTSVEAVVIAAIVVVVISMKTRVPEPIAIIGAAAAGVLLR